MEVSGARVEEITRNGDLLGSVARTGKVTLGSRDAWGAVGKRSVGAGGGGAVGWVLGRRLRVAARGSAHPNCYRQCMLKPRLLCASHERDVINKTAPRVGQGPSSESPILDSTGPGGWGTTTHAARLGLTRARGTAEREGATTSFPLFPHRGKVRATVRIMVCIAHASSV